MSLMKNIITNILSQRKYDFLTEFCHKCFEDKKESIFACEYAGEDIRVFVDKEDNIHMMMPSVYNESAVSEFISSENIFSFANELNNKARYIVETCVPCKAMMNKHGHHPKSLQVILTLNLGKCDKECNPCCGDIDETDIGNFCSMKDALVDAYNNCEVKDNYYKDINSIVGQHSGIERKDMIDNDLRMNMHNLQDDISKLVDLEMDDALDDDDVYPDDEEIDDIDEDVKLEFFSKRPKKLKPFPADLIPYITVEMNDIKDANDQAMLCGYTSSKIELCDFYITCIDTNDSRYIVPHTRQYLVNLNKQLNDLLTRILRIKPVNRTATMWKVNYPDAT
jgi:hypothetical protein